MIETPPLTVFDWNDWVGLPYDRGQCWHLVRAVLREGIGLDLPEGHEAVVAAVKHWHPVTLDQVQPFDVIMIRRVHVGREHVGVIVSQGDFLHCGDGNLSSIHRYTGMQYRSRIAGVYRYQHEP